MLNYSEQDVVQGIQRQLRRIVPPLKDVPTSDYASWLADHRLELKWNESTGQYQE